MQFTINQKNNILTWAATNNLTVDTADNYALQANYISFNEAQENKELMTHYDYVQNRTLYGATLEDDLLSMKVLRDVLARNADKVACVKVDLIEKWYHTNTYAPSLDSRNGWNHAFSNGSVALENEYITVGFEDWFSHRTAEGLGEFLRYAEAGTYNVVINRVTMKAYYVYLKSELADIQAQAQTARSNLEYNIPTKKTALEALREATKEARATEVALADEIAGDHREIRHLIYVQRDLNTFAHLHTYSPKEF